MPAREHDLRQLLVSAPLQLVERPRLLQLLQTDRLLAESERCLHVTLQSLADAGVRLPAYEQVFSQMEEKYMQVRVVGREADAGVRLLAYEQVFSQMEGNTSLPDCS